MGCILGRYGVPCLCQTQDIKNQSFDSINSRASGDNQFRALMAVCKDGIFPVDTPKAPLRGQFDHTRFASSVVVYIYNTKKTSQLNIFTQAVKENPDVYLRYFPEIRWDAATEGHLIVERGRVTDFNETLEKLRKNEPYCKHSKITNKLIVQALHVAMKEDMSAVGMTMQRIGAKHAELGISARHVYAVRESFMASLEDVLDADKDVFKVWESFIKYMVNMMIKGMNDHYRKLMFVYWSVEPRSSCACFPAAMPRAITGVDDDAMDSLRNMAVTIEAVLN